MLARTPSSGVLLLLTLAFCSGTMGCQQRAAPPPQPSAQITRTAPSKPDFGTMGGGFYGGWRFTLQPLQAGSETKAEDVATLGRNLFSGMAKDPKTLDLLKRLNGDRTIAFVVVDVTQAEDKKRMEGPPGDDYMSILRVTEPQFDEGEKMPGSTLRFQVKASYFVSQNEGVQPSEFMPPLPLATFSLVLAMEDYVARHAPGWTVRDATFQYRGSNEKLPATIEEQRKDLDRWTQEYARKAREYYAGMAKN